MDEAQAVSQLARISSELWWTQLELLAIAVPLLSIVGHGLWVAGNAQLAARWPERWFSVRPGSARPWWSRLPWFRARARWLRDAGFVEVGAVVERAGLTSITHWCWWSPERSTWGMVVGMPVPGMVETLLFTRLADGTILATTPSAPVSARVRQVEITRRGEPGVWGGRSSPRIERHEQHRLASATQPSGAGSLDEAAGLLDELHHLYLRAPDGEPAQLDQPPPSVRVDRSFHSTRIVFPSRPPWFFVLLSSLVVPLVMAGWVELVRPWVDVPGSGLFFLLGAMGSFALLLRGIFALQHVLWTCPTLWLTQEELAVKIGRRTDRISLANVRWVGVEGRQVVIIEDLGTGERTHRLRLGDDAQQAWIAQLLKRARVGAPPPSRDPEPPAALRALRRSTEG